MIQFRKFYIITLMVIVYCIKNSYGESEELPIMHAKRADISECRRQYIIARTTEKLCTMDIHSLSEYGNGVLKKMCTDKSGCIKKTVNAYKTFNKTCGGNMVRNKAMLGQHIQSLDEILCSKVDGTNDFCINKIDEFLHSNPSSKKDLKMCENNCISKSFSILGKGVVSVPNYLRNDIIRANHLCSKVPGKNKYCIDKLEDFREETSYKKKMNVYCDSLCVQKVLWRDQSEYPLTYNLQSSLESIISNFTDSACLYYNDNRCGEFLLKILNNDYKCSGLRYPRIFPFSKNYTICNNEIKQIINEYGPCVNSLFSNKSGDWLNLFIEISRYSKTRRIKNYQIFEKGVEEQEELKKSYLIDNFEWTWYKSNDRAVSVYIDSSVAAHLGVTPSMIDGQGFNKYDITIKGLSKKQQKELNRDPSMSLPMFTGKINVEALKDQNKGFTIFEGSARINVPNMITVFTFIIALFYLLL